MKVQHLLAILPLLAPAPLLAQQAMGTVQTIGTVTTVGTVQTIGVIETVPSRENVGTMVTVPSRENVDTMTEIDSQIDVPSTGFEASTPGTQPVTSWGSEALIGWGGRGSRLPFQVTVSRPREAPGSIQVLIDERRPAVHGRGRIARVRVKIEGSPDIESAVGVTAGQPGVMQARVTLPRDVSKPIRFVFETRVGGETPETLRVLERVVPASEVAALRPVNVFAEYAFVDTGSRPPPPRGPRWRTDVDTQEDVPWILRHRPGETPPGSGPGAGGDGSGGSVDPGRSSRTLGWPGQVAPPGPGAPAGMGIEPVPGRALTVDEARERLERWIYPGLWPLERRQGPPLIQFARENASKFKVVVRETDRDGGLTGQGAILDLDRHSGRIQPVGPREP